MWRLIWVAVLASACGNVAKAPDAGAADAPDPDAFSCSAPMLACGAQCFDLATDHEHCGACDLACPDAEDCIAGHCTDATASCAAIAMYTPNAPSGGFTHKLDGTKFFCDFPNGLQYDELDYGQYDVAHAGFTIVSPADLMNPTLQQAFIFLYNQQHGAKLIATWTDTNCCFKGDTVVNNMNMILINGSNITPAKAAPNDVSVCNAAHTDNPGRFIMSAGGAYSPDPMPDDFFSTHTVTAGTQCSPGANPAFFWKRHN
jgi:Stigma-specific protein, Stig1